MTNNIASQGVSHKSPITSANTHSSISNRSATPNSSSSPSTASQSARNSLNLDLDLDLDLNLQHANSNPPDLIEELNDSLFQQCSGFGFVNTQFPLVLTIDVSENSDAVLSLINSIDTSLAPPIPTASTVVEINCTEANKESLEKLIYELYDYNQTHPPIQFGLDYSNFVSHPGVLFIKKLSHNLVNSSDSNNLVVDKNDPASADHALFKLLQDSSHFKSVSEIKIFSSTSNVAQVGSATSFAIVKFDVYLDVDIVISKLNKLTPNPFNYNKATPLYLNKYLNKRDRGTSRNSVSSSTGFKPPNPASRASSVGSRSSSYSGVSPSSNSPTNVSNFDTLLMENFQRFFPAKVTKATLLEFLDKLTHFGCEIDTVYFPIKNDLEDDLSDSISLLEYGFVVFKHTPDLTENILKILYFLCGLTLDKYMSFDIEKVEPHSFLDTSKEEVKSKNSLKINISQFKHVHLIYRDSNCNFLTYEHGDLVANPPNLSLAASIACKQVNYQETNLYVSNLPVVFGNDDSLWETFWQQFGTIKSAKIINPQYYKNDDSGEDFNDNKKIKSNGYGKIGFVFYTDFKMAVRAILLTNNKLITLNGSSSPILIQSSFALQKSNSNSQSNNHPGAANRAWSHPYYPASTSPHNAPLIHYPTVAGPVAPISGPVQIPATNQYYSPYYYPPSAGPIYFGSPPLGQTMPFPQPSIPPFGFGQAPFHPYARRTSNEEYEDNEESGDAEPSNYSYNGYQYPFTPAPVGYYYEPLAYENDRSNSKSR